MRHSVYGGLLVAAAAALAGPQTVRAQSQGEPFISLTGYTARGQLAEDSGIPGRPAIVAPIPTGNPGGHGFYGFAEFVLLSQTFALGDQTIAYRGLIDSAGIITGLPGTTIGSLTPALTADQFGRRSFQPGWNIGVGYKFDSGISVYASFMQVLDQKYSGGASLATPFFRNRTDLADSFLTAPVYNFPPDYAGPAQKTFFDLSAVNGGGNFYGIWNGATVMDIQFTQRYTQGEIGGRVPLLQTDYSRVYGLAGMRYAWFFERFFWRTVSTDVNGISNPFDAANYKNTLSQRMYGAYVGCGHEIYMGKRFAASVDITGAPLINVVKERVKYELGDNTTQAKRSVNDFTVVPNVNADFNLWWYPIEGVQVRLGYSAMTYFNTKYMEEPVAFNFGALDPAYNTRAFRLVHGLHFGVGLFF